jgi:hypothetical protein
MRPTTFSRWSQFFAIKIIMLSILILLGCSRGQPHKNNDRQLMMDAALVDRPNQILRHNPMWRSAGDWKLTTWTTGTTYAPDEPIDVALQLSFTGRELKQKPKSTVSLILTHVDESVKLHRELPVPFKELSDKESEWQAIMVDVFNTDSHRKGAAVLKDGEYLLEIKIVVDGTITLGPLDSLIKIDNIDEKNLFDHYREHYPWYTKHNDMIASEGDWNLTTWTTAADYPPGTPIEFGLHLTSKGPRLQSIPKAILRINLKRTGDPMELNRELKVPFKRVGRNEWEAIMADVFKTDSHRAGASILKEGNYHISYILQVNNNTTIRGESLPIYTRSYKK